ncbi:hypothetical protein [Vibrio owensii]|uniref:Uncharacterized protein n=1 Tax=Vibrio owensii CAIM 1854 = LMG 25443 TaxID=1229493 RepID=A0A0C1VAX7_9VIBR|nr:hypothetical protein [Vibrio owensii]KIF46823.1 hypothetical protein H735_28535 [Vibrio owensii CAIM 1854 = LMG 25443]
MSSEAKKYIKETRNQAWGITAFLIVTLVAVIAVSQGFLLPASDKPEIWFQRSGSIIVVVALFLEYLVQKRLEAFSNGEVPPWEAGRLYKAFYQKLAVVCVIYGLLGTMVWGYGDLIYLKFT